MRPVRLDLDGFASFRDPATIDFTDADYFAFVGPTGSGKSTVVDAMTFALYGSAPRWGSISSIQYALAPTANRCTARLVFDVNHQRYVVAREVRRTGAQIAQKSCRLERYLDPNASGDPALDAPVESLAEDPKSVRALVSELLGLEFDDFCTCVVLPQGDFATFLKASVTERQNILLKLIGAKQYDAIGKLAGRRAADAGVRVDALTAQLGDYGDATEQAESDARAREAELERLQPEAERSVETIAALGDARREGQDRLAGLDTELSTLEAVCAPPGIDELQRSLTTADRAYESASKSERIAHDAAAAAQSAVEAGPQRRLLEEVLRMRAEHAAGTERLPALAAEAKAATADQEAAAASAAAAEAELDKCRAAHEKTKTAADAATAAADTLRRRIDGLATVRVPDGVDELADALAIARGASERATESAAELERELAAARSTLDDLPERSALDELGRTVEAYAQAEERVSVLTRRRQELLSRVDAAQALLTARTEALQAARDRLDEVRTRSAAAELRPHLRVGEACPVCDQAVLTLPPALDVPLLDAARAALAAARQDHADALADRQSTATELATLETQLTTTTDHRDELDRSLERLLPGNPTGSDRDPELDRTTHVLLTERMDAANRRHTDLARRLSAARDTAQACATEARRLDARAEQARGALHTAIGRLGPEGAPPIDPGELADAWHLLASWAADRAARLKIEDLSAAQRSVEETRAALTEAQQALARAVQVARAAAEERTAAALTSQRALDEQSRLSARLAELASKLVDQPSVTELRDQLQECDRLESEARRSREVALAAARERQQAEQARDAGRLAWEQARAEFQAAREGLITLGVRGFDTGDLAKAWTALCDWAGAQLVLRHEQRSTVEAELTATAADLDRRAAGLADLLEQHGLSSPEEVSKIVPMIMIERERAASDSRTITRRRREAAKLHATIDKDTETKQVASELQRLMGSRRFPQWLADAALDTLVVDASASLMRLSNNQFDLTHDKGEFFVVDHADADSRRSVRTLSGGETFQASLALALALSEQLSTLAAGGRTTLDSIFLDEGFGTLDPDALEIVAGTLENLAQEDRMVGVITHVTALAERVPVRFEVSRDSRTSSITRTGP